LGKIESFVARSKWRVSVEKTQTYKLVREIPIEDNYDVVIAGGGPAGSAAAISAARLGARVVLIEATGCMGGMGTSGLVAAFDPMADGKRMLVGGLMREIVEIMYERGFLSPHVYPDYWRKHYHHWTPFKPEGLKLILDELAVHAGVDVRFFTRVIDPDVEENRVNGVIVNNAEGYSYIRAKTFVDATGDAILAELCGAPCREAGRDTPRIMPAASMMGQAGGTAAVQSIRTGQPGYDLDTANLVETLRQAGVYLPQNKLSKKMTR
jgi:glycine/D-amino acid oxidase-like deaminating enzyme